MTIASNLEVMDDGNPDGSYARGQHREIFAAGATKTLTASDSGSTILLDTAAGSVVTLPAPAVGLNYRVLVSVSVTSNAHSVGTDAATTFIGGGIQQMIDTTAVSEGQFADPASDVIISMNGTTTGGLIGTWLEFTCISATVWHCNGLVASSGTLATPFA